MKKNITLITAKAQSGKTTATEVFKEKLGAFEVKFAEPLRTFMMGICGIEDTDENYEKAKVTPQEVLGGHTLRYGLQTLGTDWGREKIYSKLWTSIAKKKIENQFEKYGTIHYVISDLRFDTEYNDIVSYFPNDRVEVIEIIRPGNGLDENHANHSSENGLSSAIPRTILYNNSNIVTFQHQVLSYIVNP